MSSLQKIRHLTHPERVWLTQAALLMPLMRIALRMLGWQRLMKVLDKVGKSKETIQPREHTLDHSRRMAYVTNAAASHGLVRATCLERSIVLWWLLLRRGIRSQIVLAARKENSFLQAHAWVEYESIVLNDRPDVCQYFAVLDQP